MRIAALLARSRKVTAILLRPSWPDSDSVESTFATLSANLGGRDEPCPELDGDPDDCVRQMEDLLRVKLTALAQSQGLDGSAETFGELLLTYRSWLAFLLACRNDQAGGQADIAVTVLAEDQADVTVPGLPPGRLHGPPAAGARRGQPDHARSRRDPGRADRVPLTASNG